MTDFNNYKKLIRAIKRLGPLTDDSSNKEALIIVLRIFNAMPIEERFKILKRAVEHPISPALKNPVSSEIQNTQETVQPPVIPGNTESVSEFNQKELIKLKMFFLRFFTGVVIIVAGLFALAYLILGSNAVHSGNSFIKEAVAIFQDLFN